MSHPLFDSPEHFFPIRLPDSWTAADPFPLTPVEVSAVACLGSVSSGAYLPQDLVAAMIAIDALPVEDRSDAILDWGYDLIRRLSLAGWLGLPGDGTIVIDQPTVLAKLAAIQALGTHGG